MKTVTEVLRYIKEQNVGIVDLKFTDLPGMWQHFSIPAHVLTEEVWTNGIPFDGSSIRGFQTIDESDMAILPDPASAVLDPCTKVPTLSLTCFIVQPESRESYTRDPRYIAHKAEEYLRSTGIADTAYMGPEAEFYVFHEVHYGSVNNVQLAVVDSAEAEWYGNKANTGLGHLMRTKEGYFPVSPNDTLQDVRSAMTQRLEATGITVEAHHHEVGAAGQCEIDLRYDTLLSMADKVMMYKYIVKNIAKSEGLSATFMPKPLFGDNGSGMHVHQSLWKDNKPLFYDEQGYAHLSQLAKSYLAGLLLHAPALLAFAASTTNSYKRLVPGYEAPVNLVFSRRNRSAAVRIPVTSSPKATRIEFRPPDPAANPYLLFSALLMAGLDGVQKELDPEMLGYGPYDTNVYELDGTARKAIRSVPSSLHEALTALENDHTFLLHGDVFTNDVLEHYIALKRKQADEVQLRPVPIEFSLYYDA